MDALIQDLRYGLRTLVASPGFTAVAVLTLALGIGACTAIFSAVNVLLLRPLPYADPDRLVIICEESRDLPEMSVAYPNFLDWQAQSRSFERLAAFRFISLNVTGGEADPERVDARSVTSGFLRTLGAPPAIGRDFAPEDDRPGAEPVAILGSGFWKRRFAADSGVVGRNILLDGRSYTVIGVAPARLRFIGEPDLWTPLGLSADRFMERGEHPGIYVVGRLAPGVTLAAARAELDGIAKRLEAQYPDSNAAHGIGVTAAHDYFVKDIRPILLVLLGAVGFVLLIACVNVANLMLARGITRDREIAVRSALGAGRRRLVRMLLTESLLLSTLGGALGVLLAYWGVDLLAAAVPPDFPLPERIGIDGAVLVFTLAVAVLTGILSGLAPALRTSRVDLSRTLKEGGRGSTAGHTRLRQALVVSETALALVLLIGAGLAMKSFLRLARVDPGLNPENVLTLSVSLPESRYPDGPGQARFFRQALERIGTLPGVVAAGMITPLPFTGEGWQSNYLIEGRPRPPSAEQPSLDKHFVSPGYFRAMQIPLVAGRLFDETDDAKALKVAVVNRTMAERFWAGEDPVGKRIQQGDADDPAKADMMVIVGIVGDVRQYGPWAPAKSEVYMPHAQRPIPMMSLVVRAAVDPKSLVSSIRREIAVLDKDQPIYGVRTMVSVLEERTASNRLATELLLAFAAAALVLASVGIYGVVAYSVTRRTHEIGIRMALGASRRDVLRLIVSQGAALALAGVTLGLLAAVPLVRVLRSLLFEVSATDPGIFAWVAILLILVAVTASYIPAVRASRIDPMVALRHE